MAQSNDELKVTVSAEEKGSDPLNIESITSILNNRSVWMGNDRASIHIDDDGNIRIKGKVIFESPDDVDDVKVTSSEEEDEDVEVDDDDEDPIRVVEDYHAAPDRAEEIIANTEKVINKQMPAEMREDVKKILTERGIIGKVMEKVTITATEEDDDPNLPKPKHPTNLQPNTPAGAFWRRIENAKENADQMAAKQHSADWASYTEIPGLADLSEIAAKHTEKVAGKNEKSEHVVKAELTAIAEELKRQTKEPLGANEAGCHASPVSESSYRRHGTKLDDGKDNLRKKLEEELLDKVVRSYAEDVEIDDVRKPVYIHHMKDAFRKRAVGLIPPFSGITECEAGMLHFLKEIDQKHAEQYPKVEKVEPSVVEVTRPWNLSDLKDLKDGIKRQFKKAANEVIYKTFNGVLDVMSSLKEKVDEL